MVFLLQGLPIRPVSHYGCPPWPDMQDLITDCLQYLTINRPKVSRGVLTIVIISLTLLFDSSGDSSRLSEKQDRVTTMRHITATIHQHDQAREAKCDTGRIGSPWSKNTINNHFETLQMTLCE